jgi:uncharacterized protein (TIGR02246 family)
MIPTYPASRRAVIAALMLAIGSSLAAQGAAVAQPPQADLQRANAAFVKGDWAAVLAAYSDIATRFPQHALTRFRIGVAHNELGHFAEGEAALREGERLGIAAPQAALRLAQGFAAAGRKDAAFAELQRAIKARLTVAPAAVDGDPHFAGLRDDPRWTGVLDGLDAVARPCMHNPKAREFDYWAGDWDVWPTGTPRPAQPARNTVTIEDNGCVVMEHWTAPGGSEGQSFNIYDGATGEWRQTWVDNTGGQHDYHGGLKDGNMSFLGTIPKPSGGLGHVPVRLTFFRMGKDTVRQFSEATADSGKTWTVNYDLTYVRRPNEARGAPLNQGDIAAITALDSAYVRSWLNDDAASVLALFMSDAQLLPPGWPPVSGIDAIRKYWWPQDGSRTKITKFERTIGEIGGNRDLAFLRSTTTLSWEYTKDGKTTAQTSRSTELQLLMRNQAGAWRVARQMWSPLP